MPSLDCSVIKYKYNEDHGCVRDQISVGGMNAKTSSETSCDSFEERRSDSFTNSFREPSMSVNIHCDAEKCVHNDDCKCTADSIDVNGSNACRCGQTACGTFIERN